MLRSLVEMCSGWELLNFYQFGFWLSRDTGRIRLVLEDEEDMHEPEVGARSPQPARVL